MGRRLLSSKTQFSADVVTDPDSQFCKVFLATEHFLTITSLGCLSLAFYFYISTILIFEGAQSTCLNLNYNLPVLY